MPRIVSPRLSRRLLLSGGSALAASYASGIASPYISRASDRPQIGHGVRQCFMVNHARAEARVS